MDADEQILSVLHLKRGFFIASTTAMKLKFFIPGKSQKSNYLGYLQEDKPI
jgi:hypothetical protein